VTFSVLTITFDIFNPPEPTYLPFAKYSIIGGTWLHKPFTKTYNISRQKTPVVKMEERKKNKQNQSIPIKMFGSSSPPYRSIKLCSALNSNDLHS
jgi:hypothetical protein